MIISVAYQVQIVFSKGGSTLRSSFDCCNLYQVNRRVAKFLEPYIFGKYIVQVSVFRNNELLYKVSELN